MSAEHSAYLKPELYGNGTQPGYTPFLDSLMRQSLCFGQMYANGTRSIQAMPAVLGSIPSFKQPFVLMPQSLGKSRQLPQILRDKGYRTAFFCGSERGSMGFGAYARSASIERLLSREDYGRRTLENAGTILRHAVHPLVAPSLRRARTISQRAARRNDQNP